MALTRKSEYSGSRILVVDDHEPNARLLVDLLSVHGFDAVSAGGGEAALAEIARHSPDLVLLDVMMPGLDGYEVCRRLRANADCAALPIVLVTALDPQEERVRGLEAGADDFLAKPIHAPELLARVRSLLRVKHLYDQTQAQARELAELNRNLETRIEEEVAKNAKLARLKRFLSPQLADLVVAGGATDPLVTHRREIAVVFADLRGFTGFAETVEPEVLMACLREYHAAMGQVIQRFGGTLERFTGDGLMVFLNDPVPIPDPARRAVDMALAMRDAADDLAARWRQQGFKLGVGLGVALGYATLGAIGFEERIDYGAIGTVTNIAARLCGEAAAGEIWLSQRVHAEVDGSVAMLAMGSLILKGMSRPQQVYRIPARIADTVTQGEAV